MPKPATMQTGHSNDFQSPPWVIQPLVPYLRGQIVWECACGTGNLVKALRAEGIMTHGTDLNGGVDFLTTDHLPTMTTRIVTNPPYTLKNKFLERCYLIGLPFALLLPLTTFETSMRQMLFRNYGVEVIFLPRRVNFETPSGEGTGAWFATAWFTHGFKIGKELTFWKE